MGLQLLIKQVHIVLIVNCLWLLLTGDLISSTDSDISCLKSLKSSFVDPNNYLKSSWNFDNTTEGFICRFTGVECWHPDENRVLNIKLADMGLKGEFPRGIQNCTSMTGLDLSVNKISGEIPSDISKLIGFITSLDLSSNNFSGQIPLNLANCSYLNVLKLDHNRLTGQIPAELGNLNRIKTFSVTNNLLTGPVPTFSANVTIPADSYASNLGLCGKPLDPCKAPPKKSSTGIIAGAAVGGVTFAALVVGLGMIFYYRKMSKFRKKKNDDPEGNKWAKSLKKTKGVKVKLIMVAIVGLGGKPMA